MKRIYIALAALLVAGSTVNAQGVYKNVDDFDNNKLSYTYGAEKTVVKADIPFNSSSVKVINDGEAMVLDKWGLYGYRDGKNNDYRFIDNKSYKVVDAAEFPLYSRVEYVVKGKEKTRVTKYFFAKDSDSPVMPLTISNLKYAFPMSRDFHDLLDLQFRSNKELTRYDKHYNEYKLKSVFAKTVR